MHKRGRAYAECNAQRMYDAFPYTFHDTIEQNEFGRRYLLHAYPGQEKTITRIATKNKVMFEKHDASCLGIVLSGIDTDPLEVRNRSLVVLILDIFKSRRWT